MDEILRISDLSFNYDGSTLLDKINLSLNYNEWYTLIGPNGVGKTTLIKIISGLLLNYDGKVEFNFLELNKENLFEIRTRMAILFNNVDDLIIEDNIYDEITFELKNMDYNETLIEKYIAEVDEYTHIKEFINKDILALTIEEKYLLVLTSALIIKPKLLVIDETFSHLSKSARSKLYKIIKDYQKENKLTVLNITHDLEDSLLGDNIILMDKGKVSFNEKVRTVFDEKMLATELSPRIVRLSDYMRLYELTDKNYYTMEELIDALWK